MTAEEAQERVIKYLEKELTEKDQFIGANYLENDKVYVFTVGNNCINSSEKCKNWMIYKEDGRIEEFIPLEKLRAIRKEYKCKVIGYETEFHKKL